VCLDGPWQARGEVALLQPAYQTTDAQGYGKDGATYHEFETPAS
jgi:hypothetical protein